MRIMRKTMTSAVMLLLKDKDVEKQNSTEVIDDDDRISVQAPFQSLSNLLILWV